MGKSKEKREVRRWKTTDKKDAKEVKKKIEKKNLQSQSNFNQYHKFRAL